jgi:hypothetical protein
MSNITKQNEFKPAKRKENETMSSHVRFISY